MFIASGQNFFHFPFVLSFSRMEKITWCVFIQSQTCVVGNLNSFMWISHATALQRCRILCRWIHAALCRAPTARCVAVCTPGAVPFTAGMKGVLMDSLLGFELVVTCSLRSVIHQITCASRCNGSDRFLVHFRKEIVYFGGWFLCSKPTKRKSCPSILQIIYVFLQWHKETSAWPGFYALAEMSSGCQVRLV